MSAAAPGSAAQDGADAPCKKWLEGTASPAGTGVPRQGDSSSVTPVHGCSGPGCPLGDGAQCRDGMPHPQPCRPLCCLEPEPCPPVPPLP